MQKRLDSIKRDKVNWNENADEVGINVDEELDEEEIGQRFTKLKPEGGPGQRRDRFRDNNTQRDRRGRSQGPRQSNRGFNNFDDEERERRPRNQDTAPKTRQQKFNGGAMEEFPTF